MKVLQVINNMDIGGAETLLKNYVLNNKDISIQNSICLLQGNDSFILEEIKKNNVKVYNLNLKNKYMFVSALLKLNKIIRKNKFDVVHMHLFPGQYYGAILKIINNNVKFVFSEHSDSNTRRDKKVFYPLEKFSYSKYDNILCISEMTKRSLVKFIPKLESSSEVLYGGIKQYPIRSNEKIYDVILVGSLRSNVKGIDLLLRAIELIRNKVKKVCIVGDGILMNEMVSLRDRLGLTEIVEFAGNQKDVNSYLSKSKIFALPSRWEGFGLAIIEAMAQQVPIVATEVGGIPEIITDMESGILVKAEDYIQLSKAIENLLRDENLRNYLSTNAYSKMQHCFSIDVYTDKLNHIYKTLV
ncbi:glycosyltransferase [Clostridium fungisolvens]|uniref:N-acetyl-alpha-D-glucosaminyl L-malate synthase n=1 Tax=Clostridium fungisolvens TaxID=1604897 RepID=A0A6V8S9M7_9CLOT|nr:glycosyltransferase [Clostridium fungisolvens]GFP73969.1 N-acetyl-alpha-D-glucosaminyl L-malate synthase [Clostridium fungisolvens]